MNEFTNMGKIKLTTFTDPMMGLSYECEPIFRKLETHFADRIEFHYVMSGLVRNVYDFVHPDDLSKGKDIAIRNYNARLAKIYEHEESIMGMPINMTDFHLFSPTHTTSLPLNLAYKAAQLTNAEKANQFLYNLRYATIVETRPTTQREEILAVVQQTGMDVEVFCQHFDGETARTALQQDLDFGHKLGIHSLPAYLLEYGEKKMLIQSLIGYDAFVSMIAELTCGMVKPQPVVLSPKNLEILLDKHPLISPIELREAFDLISLEEVINIIHPLVSTNKMVIREVPHGWFIVQAVQD